MIIATRCGKMILMFIRMIYKYKKKGLMFIIISTEQSKHITHKSHTHTIKYIFIIFYVRTFKSYTAIRSDGLTDGHCYLLWTREEHHFHPTTFKSSGYNIIYLYCGYSGTYTRLMSRTGFFFSAKKPNCFICIYYV